VSILTDAFGIMMSQVEHQEAALAAYRTLMENEAAERAGALERANAQLAAEKIRTDQAARLKDEFLANTSHEIRTAMNGVLGMAQLALETDLTAEQREYITSARSSAEFLLKVVDDIIDFSRIETGELSLEREEFSISDTLYEVMRLFSPAARKKGISAYAGRPQGCSCHGHGRPEEVSPGDGESDP
jgi:signal transduction histidine kinase